MKFPIHLVPDNLKTAFKISLNWKHLTPHEECRFYKLQQDALYLSVPIEYRIILQHETDNIIHKVNIFLGYQVISIVRFVNKDI